MLGAAVCPATVPALVLSYSSLACSTLREYQSLTDTFLQLPIRNWSLFINAPWFCTIRSSPPTAAPALFAALKTSKYGTSMMPITISVAVRRSFWRASMIISNMNPLTKHRSKIAHPDKHFLSTFPYYFEINCHWSWFIFESHILTVD